MQTGIDKLVESIGRVIISPAILLLFGVALVVFIWGLVKFLWALNGGGKADTGKQHMLWGLVGMFVMTAAWGIFNLIDNTVKSLQ